MAAVLVVLGVLLIGLGAVVWWTGRWNMRWNDENPRSARSSRNFGNFKAVQDRATAGALGPLIVLTGVGFAVYGIVH